MQTRGIRRTPALLLRTACGLALGSLVYGLGLSAQTNHVVTATQANGVYRHNDDEFRILALGHNRLKVQYSGVYITAAGGQNTGNALGEATINGDVATFIPPDTQNCKITITFLPNKLHVTQADSDGDCGFGHNVSAEGAYRKVKSGRPRFLPLPQ